MPRHPPCATQMMKTRQGGSLDWCLSPAPPTFCFLGFHLCTKVLGSRGFVPEHTVGGEWLTHGYRNGSRVDGSLEGDRTAAFQWICASGRPKRLSCKERDQSSSHTTRVSEHQTLLHPRPDRKGTTSRPITPNHSGPPGPAPSRPSQCARAGA